MDHGRLDDSDTVRYVLALRVAPSTMTNEDRISGLARRYREGSPPGLRASSRAHAVLAMASRWETTCVDSNASAHCRITRVVCAPRRRTTPDH
jgi:hypothetical protein